MHCALPALMKHSFLYLSQQCACDVHVHEHTGHSTVHSGSACADMYMVHVHVHCACKPQSKHVHCSQKPFNVILRPLAPMIRVTVTADKGTNNLRAGEMLTCQVFEVNQKAGFCYLQKTAVIPF